MARLTGPGKKLGVSQSSNAAKVAANKAKVEANRKKVQANAAKYKTSTSTKKSPALANQKVATKTAAAAAKKTEYVPRVTYLSPARGTTMAQLNKTPSMDSTKFMNLARTSAPYSKSVTTPKGNVLGPVGYEKGGVKQPGPANLYNDLKREMAKTAKKYPGARFSDFKLDTKTGAYTYKVSSPKK